MRKRNQDGTTTVMFRVSSEGRGKNKITEVVAVFPCEPENHKGDMSCYAHLGQHGACAHGWLRSTRPAKPDEYANLMAELKNYGPAWDKPYAKLRVVQKITAEMREVFNTRLEEMRR